MKSADMTDEQIDKLWVNIAIDDLTKIVSQDTVIVKGGKGSGKTHLLRHHSFPLQKIRWTRSNLSIFDGIKNDGYIGIYLRCSGLNASRFQGKSQSEEVWSTLFEYAHELLLAHELIHIARSIISDPNIEHCVSQKILTKFDKADYGYFNSLEQVEDYIELLRKKLDLAINNSAFDVNFFGKEETIIRVTRGNLIFGIPQILGKYVRELEGIPFLYFIDEYENFTEWQQCYVNTLIREKQPPVGIKVGVRKYGIKTYKTLSAGEDLLEGSEYQTLSLDQKLRENMDHYRKFSYELLHNRLRDVCPLLEIDNNLSNWAKGLFETFDMQWNSNDVYKLIEDRQRKKSIKPIWEKLKENLSKISHKIDEKLIKEIIEILSVEKYPLLEKVNIFNFFKAINKNTDLIKTAQVVAEDCRRFIENPSADTDTKNRWSHLQQNFVHQLLKDYGLSPYYSGIDNFIDMSEGMPRNLINILKQMYDWSLFKDESFDTRKWFSLDVQNKGVKKASDWFFNDMRQTGKDGILVQTAINRLAEIFKINHYSEKPVECSLITFSADLHEVSDEANRIIKIAEDRSLLIRIDDGHRDKNYSYTHTKYQLNKMLAPRWGLPIARRGTTEFSANDLNIIFDCENNTESAFKILFDKWRAKTLFLTSNNAEIGNIQGKLL